MWVFNPFTGTLDFKGKGGGDVSGISFSDDFLVADWIAVGGFYTLDIQHNLESERLIINIWEGSQIVTAVDRIDYVNTNTIRLFTSIDPDCRFDGTINIIKT